MQTLEKVEKDYESTIRIWTQEYYEGKNTLLFTALGYPKPTKEQWANDILEHKLKHSERKRTNDTSSIN